MASHYYKKIKSDQVEIFCIVVECDCNMTKAGHLLGLSTGAISSKVSSLAKDMGFDLFGKKANQLFLTPKGKAYYRVVKNKPRIFISKIDERANLCMIKKIFYTGNNFIVKEWNKMFIKITLKRLFFFYHYLLSHVVTFT